MARNGSGAYSLPAGNPVVTNTTISSAVHNNTMSDLASEMTNSTDKDGQTVITGAWDFNANKIILDLDADTSITADTDDQIDIEIAGADDFQFTANTFTALSGSTIATNTIAETTGANGVVIDSVTLKDGNVVLGSGNGIDFSATADGTTMVSELLDDYEEGTFVPELWDNSDDDASSTYAANGQKGFYTRVGNLVFFHLRMELATSTGLTGGEQARIGNLPFTSSSATNDIGTAHIGVGASYNFTASNTPTGNILVGATSVTLAKWSATTGTTALTVTECTGDVIITCSGSYRAA